MIRQASAPGRCGLLGNPSDIYGGAVLACSLGLRATCRLVPSECDEPPEDPTLWDAARSYARLDGPVRVEWRTDVPRSSGLAGSTALLAATMLAAGGDASNPLQFALDVRRAERVGAGIVCGWQDAVMAVHGGLALLDFAGYTPDAPDPSHAVVTPLDAPLPFLLITTGVERLSGSVHGPVVARWRAGDPEVRAAVAEIGELARPGAEALASGEYAALGRLMARNHALVAGLGGSGEPVDRLIALCLRHGARGAKLAGAGLGGTVVALTENPDGLRRALETEGYTRFAHPEIAPGARLETA